MDFNFSVYKGRNLADTHAHMLDEKLTLKKEEIANGLYDNGIKFAVEIGNSKTFMRRRESIPNMQIRLILTSCTNCKSL